MGDVRDWLTLAQVLALLVSVVINVWIYFAARSDERWKTMRHEFTEGDRLMAERLGGLDRDVGASKASFDKRLSVLETTVSGLPKHGDVRQIRDQLAHIDKSVAALDERTEHTAEAVARIEKYLLERK